MTLRPIDRPVRRRRLAALALAALAAGAATFVPATTATAQYPEPSFAPVAWEFDFDWRMPKRVVLREPGGELRAYWYMPYTVTNETEQERTFLPEIELITKDGQILPANDNIPMGVFLAIKNRTPSLPLVPPQEVGGRLLIGEDRARSSVAIWREPMVEMGTFTIFVGGLSGEIVRLTGPDGAELSDDDGNPILVRKTKRLVFRVLGDGVDTGETDEVRREQDDWVMR